MRCYLKVDENYGLVPVDDEGISYIYRRKPGDVLSCDIKVERNYRFHCKLFALFNTVHENLPPPDPIEFRGKMITPDHTLDGTRHYLTVQAGFYDVIGLPNGKVRVEPKSLAFNKMSEEEFEKLYSAVIDAALKILPKNWSSDELERVATQIVNFV